MAKLKNAPVALIIMDGFGDGERSQEQRDRNGKDAGD